MMYREVIELNDRDDDDDGKQNPRWVRLTPAELLLEAVSAIATVGCFVLVIYYWGKVDDQIPVYFIYGVAMAWLPRAYLLLSPLIALVMWSLMSLYAFTAQKKAAINLKSQKFGRMQYLTDRLYLGLIKTVVLCMLFLTERRIILLALGQRPGVVDLAVFAVALAVILFKYISRRSKIT